MTRKQHQEALKALKEVNKLRIKSETLIDKDTVRVEYKWQKILLSNGMTLVLSGSMEQHNQIHCTTEHLFLCVSLLDENGVDLKHTPAQHSVLKNQVAELIR
jgi:hypothetical protein